MVWLTPAQTQPALSNFILVFFFFFFKDDTYEIVAAQQRVGVLAGEKNEPNHEELFDTECSPAKNSIL